MESFSSTAHWRDSAKNSRFFLVDARAAFPLVLFLLHIRLWTAIVALLSMCFFALIEKAGFTLPVFIRWLRSTLAGPDKTSSPWWKE